MRRSMGSPAWQYPIIKYVCALRFIHPGGEFGIDCEFLFYVTNEYGDFLFEGASEPRALIHNFCADLDRGTVIFALEGTQQQVVAGRVEQEQRDIIE